MNFARMQSVELGRNVLVPVVIEWPDVGAVSECLHWVLSKLTYIRWPENLGEQEDFWMNLRQALIHNGGHRSTIDPPDSLSRLGE